MGDLALSETEFQQRIVQYAQLRGWLVSHVQSVTMAGKGGRVIRQTPAAKGFPDLTLARDGQVWFMEVKSERGAVSADQLNWLWKLSGVDRAASFWNGRQTPGPKHVDHGRLGVVVVRPRHWDWIQGVLR
jgi:hypothetical protein